MDFEEPSFDASLPGRPGSPPGNFIPLRALRLSFAFGTVGADTNVWFAGRRFGGRRIGPARLGMDGVPWPGLGLLLKLGLTLGLLPELELLGVGSRLDGALPAARPGGVPCRDRWNAFILASILSGTPPLEPGGGMPRTLDICADGGLGLRAFCSRARWVEDGGIAALGGVETGRNDGRRRVSVESSSYGLNGDSRRISGDVVPGEPPSPEEFGVFSGGVTIADSQQFYSRGMSWRSVIFFYRARQW